MPVASDPVVQQLLLVGSEDSEHCRPVALDQVPEALIKEWQPDAIVVGLPLNMDGSPSEMSERAEKFGRRLNGRFNLPVFTHDERLTTYAAKGERLAQGQRDGYRERPVDALAAALLLEGWLAEHPD